MITPYQNPPNHRYVSLTHRYCWLNLGPRATENNKGSVSHMKLRLASVQSHVSVGDRGPTR